MECEFYFNKVFFFKRMFFLMCLKCRQGMRYWNVLERTSLWDCIKPCYSKCGLWISNMGNTQQLVGTAESCSFFPPDLLNENLYFNNIFRWYVCILTFETHWYRPCRVDICHIFWISSIFSTLFFCVRNFPHYKMWKLQTGLPRFPCSLGIHHLGSIDQSGPLVQRHTAEEAGTVQSPCGTRQNWKHLIRRANSRGDSCVQWSVSNASCSIYVHWGIP